MSKTYTERVKHCPTDSCFNCEFFKADESSLYVPTCRKPFDEVKTVVNKPISQTEAKP